MFFLLIKVPKTKWLRNNYFVANGWGIAEIVLWPPMLPQKSEARGIISNMLHSYGAQDATWNSALENFRMIHRWFYLDSESFGVEIWMCEKNPWFDILWFDAADMICRYVYIYVCIYIYLRFASIINELIRSQSADHTRVVCWACFADDMFREFDSCLSLKELWILYIFRWLISETCGLPNAMEASEPFRAMMSLENCDIGKSTLTSTNST